MVRNQHTPPEPQDAPRRALPADDVTHEYTHALDSGAPEDPYAHAMSLLDEPAKPASTEVQSWANWGVSPPEQPRKQPIGLRIQRQDKPATVEGVTGFNRFLHGRLGKVATAAALVAVTSGIGIAVAKVAGNGPEHTVAAIGTQQIEKGPPKRDLTPVTEKVSVSVQEDIEDATFVDTCETKVTSKEVISMYENTFNTYEKPDMNIDELTERVNEVTARVEQTRTSQDFAKLPANFAELEKDAFGDHAIPLDEYHEAAKEFFGQFGVKAVFDWDTSGEAVENPQTRKQWLRKIATPIHESNLGENDAIRRRVTGAMKVYATISPAVLKQADGKVIAFGDFIDSSYAGTTTVGGGIGLIVLSGERLEKNSDNTGHEFGHQSSDGACGYVIFFDHIEDPAISSLNGKFRYGDKLGGKFAGLDSDEPGKVVSTGGYGTQSPAEDIAEIAGRFFDPSGIKTVLTQERDMRIFNMKGAFIMARAAHGSDAARTYLADQFALARLQIITEERLRQANEEVSLYYEEHPDATLETDTKYADLENVAERYTEMAGLLIRTQGGSLRSS